VVTIGFTHCIPPLQADGRGTATAVAAFAAFEEVIGSRPGLFPDPEGFFESESGRGIISEHSQE
jgi:hypothetical protein